jgi:hypothetical protein
MQIDSGKSLNFSHKIASKIRWINFLKEHQKSRPISFQLRGLIFFQPVFKKWSNSNISAIEN